MTLADIATTRRSAGSSGDSALQAWVRALEATAPIVKQPQHLLCDVIAEVAREHGVSPALLSDRETLTYRALVERANRYARWALAQDLRKDETVCLLMPNRPDYLAIWLGITGVGGVVSLINTQLRGQALAHCIDLVAPHHVIVDAELISAFQTAPLASKPQIWSHGSDDFLCIDRAIEKLSGDALSAKERRNVTSADRALTIYTSGTTGLPKAANVSHHRLLQWSLWFAGLMKASPDDRIYDCLPLYHSVGGVVAPGALLASGGSVVIAEKFSTRQFWDDIAKWDCTLFQYIGELCRYLVNAPDDRRERAHRLRLCAGNGLRADVWEKFQSRFAIPKILEFYAATEGNVSLYNVEGKVGAIGRVPPFLKHRFPLALVKFDDATGAPARDGNGRCIRCPPGEVGEAIGKIRSRGNTSETGGDFEGYTNGADTERKILRDVFEAGDAWYRTGDLMRADSGGFYYFVDRIGDTFRWKGENVATSEVADAIVTFPGIAEAVVYGVAIPGTEGAAGMATLVGNGKSAIDLAGLRKHLTERLPPYARPLFLRIKDGIDITSTFKHKKSDLAREGFDPKAAHDAIYFDDPERQAYVPLDAALHARIVTGDVRL
ncbi:MAG TPA: long-chain-acyl-CoA synthetase [Xanthobacteraceae bacterium]|jgi:fatty-acyl-CoA synthase|nr:long-chain-acyl-CoA synthetase [Xanthobacteraceae bacterium]